MYWERVTEEIYLFTSDRYALVNSTAILTKEGLVVVDALPFPNEAQQIARFLVGRTGLDFHSLILTHHHMDHVYGMDSFPETLDLISHELCRQKLLEIGQASLEEARRNNPAFDEVELRIPTITYSEGDFLIRAGEKTFRLIHLPGHTIDNTGVFYEEERVLISGDAVMAIPIIAHGDWDTEMATLKRIKALEPETIIQGHGEVILSGEIDIVIDRYIDYLTCVYKTAEKALEKNMDRRQIWKIPLEECGLERVPLGIASHQLHIANILYVREMLEQRRAADEGKEEAASE
ncbi:MAG: MBL fold metallo-hydrolase [Anaerolineales bacterium]